jgi:uncharacterized membrane protein
MFIATDKADVVELGVFPMTNYFKAFWIFLLGSVFGFVVETVWCVYRHGRLEMRSSMVFGPFTVIYGLGALILYLGLSYLKQNSLFQIIIFGAVAGTAVEFVSSYLQEKIVGSVSWDYSAKPFNIGGRVCLLYSVYWGVLAIAWCKKLQPIFEKLIKRIPPRIYKPLTITLTVLIAVDVVISVAAVARWGMRLSGVPASGSITFIIDSLFPNHFMEALYPNMLW